MTAPIPHLGNPEDQSLKEYIVTLKDFNDSDGFYEDMETIGGTLYIPDRIVECTNKLPISRNTHYMLTYDEAATVRNDDRVFTVELNPTDLGLVKGINGFSQYSTSFDKGVGSNSNSINWGLLRCLRKTDINNWGINGTVSQTATIVSDCSGKNVDVVIMDDGTPYPTVLEYQQNPDGTGYNRMVEYNWFQHDPEVLGLSVSNYEYQVNRLQEHGGHTTGTVAGNTQGWARDANIYNLTYDDAENIQYVRMFHRNKPVNPITGVKNPTIVNNSWGYSSTTSLLSTKISQITIQGTVYNPISGTAGSYVWDSTFLQNTARIRVSVRFPARNAATDADFIDAMNEGVIIVGSAGNSYFYEDMPGGLDYDNTMVFDGSTYYIHRGSSPGAAWGDSENSKVICVGATGQHNESTGTSLYSATGIETNDYKAEYSNYGPRIDCYAPGSGIQSVWNSTETLYDSNPTPDPRAAVLGVTDTVNNNFKKCPGTSMSGPQVTGVLACLAEKYPRMTQSDARLYISKMPLTVLSTNGGANDGKDAGFTYNPLSVKPMLFLQGTRAYSTDIGGYYPTPFPETLSWTRPTNGQMYPRRRIVHTANSDATFELSSDNNTVSNGQTVTVTLTTTNIPNNTHIQYVITANQLSASPVYTSSALDGVFTATSRIAGAFLDTRPNKGNRILSIDSSSATVTSIPNDINGGVNWPNYSTNFSGSTDDGYWQVPLPFNVSFLGSSYSDVYVGSNSYITFGNGSILFASLTEANPAYPKIMISAADNSCQTLKVLVSGTTPNRTCRIRFEGTAGYSGVSGSPNMVFEAVFHEDIPAQIDIHTGVNARWALTTSVYPFDYKDVSVPLVDTLTVNDNTAILPITITSDTQYVMTVRLGVTPTPTVNVTVN